MNPLRVHWERIRRRWLLILLVGVLAAGASAGAVLLQPATYTARSTLTNASPDEDRKPEQDTVLAQGYADYFNQLSTQQVLRAETGADPSVEVTARLAASGPILYVEATADDAALAGDTATKMATGLRDDVNAGIDNNGSTGDDPEQASNRLRDLALVAGVVENPTDAGRTALAALVGGLLMGLLGAIALGRFESRLVTAREVHDRLGLDVLAAMRGARRGQSDAEARQQVLRSLMSITDAHGMPRPGTLVVTGPSSTRRSQAVVATALASLRARQGQTTLLVRADPETAGDDDPGAPGVTDFLSEGTTARLGGRVRSNGHDLLICPPGTRRSGLHELYAKTQFARMFAQGTGMADLVVVDAPPIDTREGRAVCAAADRSLIVVEEGRTRAAHALGALGALGEAGATALGAVLVRDPARLPGPGVLIEGPWHEAAPPPDMTQPLAVVPPPAEPGRAPAKPAAEPVATPARTSGGDS